MITPGSVRPAMNELCEPRLSVFQRLQQRVFLFRSPWRDIIQYILLVVVLVWLMSISTSRLGYNWQWHRIPRYLFRMEDGRLVAGFNIREGVGPAFITQQK